MEVQVECREAIVQRNDTVYYLENDERLSYIYWQLFIKGHGHKLQASRLPTEVSTQLPSFREKHHVKILPTHTKTTPLLKSSCPTSTSMTATV